MPPGHRSKKIAFLYTFSVFCNIFSLLNDAHSQGQNTYDGKWSMALNCGPATLQGGPNHQQASGSDLQLALTYNFTIINGSSAWSASNRRWTLNASGETFSVSAQSFQGFSISLNGRAQNTSSARMSGSESDRSGLSIRLCNATLTMNAPTSVAATSNPERTVEDHRNPARTASDPTTILMPPTISAQNQNSNQGREERGGIEVEDLQRTAEAQRELRRLGLYAGVVDGRHGPQTRAAVQEFQRRTQTRPTGIVTAELLDALRRTQVQPAAPSTVQLSNSNPTSVQPEVRARTEAEARTRQEADIRARIEAEVRTRFEAETRERQEADARAQAEAQQRQQAPTVAITRRDAEARARLQIAEPQQREGIVPTAQRRVALVIGNGSYRFATSLRNPANDARRIATLLQGIGFEVIMGVDLDRRAMETQVREFSRRLEGAALGLLFYAGHGLQIGGENHLLPIDAKLERESDLAFETLPLSTILRSMESSAAANLIFLDACRDNPLTRNLSLALGARSASVGRGLAPVQSGLGTLVAYATQPGNIALDGTGVNSPFTDALSRHIATPGLEIGLAMRRVREAVVASTSSRQVPWDHSSLTGEVVLVPAPSPRPTASPEPQQLPAQSQQQPFGSVNVDALFWQSAITSGRPADFEAYLAAFPNGLFAPLARSRLGR